MSGVSAGFLNNYANYYRLIPLLTPCIKKKSYEEDFDLKMKRTLITAIGTSAISMTVSVSALIVLSNRFPQISANTDYLLLPASALSSAFAACIAYMTILNRDERRANQALDVKAVEEYINLEIPSTKATLHIQCNLTALQLLIARGGDVNKLDKKKTRLLDYTRNLKIYELLAEHANTKLLDSYKVSYFKRAIEHKKSKYLKCIVKHNESNLTKITPNDFTPEQQIQFWLDAGNLKAIDLLKSLGFDINIQDSDGCTPLLKLLEKITFKEIRYNNKKFTGCEHVRALLKSGARPVQFKDAIEIREKSAKKIREKRIKEENASKIQLIADISKILEEAMMAGSESESTGN